MFQAHSETRVSTPYFRRLLFLSPYTLSAQVMAGGVTYEEAVVRVRELFLEAVRKRLSSDRGVGVFCSGGLDSVRYAHRTV